MPRDESYILDMITAVEEILRFVRQHSFEQFIEDDLVMSAVLYQFIVLGEAANRISAEFTAKHPEIEWHSVRGMRNRIAHGYDEVDYAVVWETIHRSLVPLVEKLRPLLPPKTDN